LLTITGFI